MARQLVDGGDKLNHLIADKARSEVAKTGSGVAYSHETSIALATMTSNGPIKCVVYNIDKELGLEGIGEENDSPGDQQTPMTTCRRKNSGEKYPDN
jgi:hypothetical protein